MPSSASVLGSATDIPVGVDRPGGRVGVAACGATASAGSVWVAISTTFTSGVIVGALTSRGGITVTTTERETGAQAGRSRASKKSERNLFNVSSWYLRQFVLIMT